MVALAVFWLPQLRNEVQPGETAVSDKPTEDRSTRYRFLAWVGAFTSFTFLGALLNIFPVFGREVMLFRKSVIGEIVFARGLFTTLGFLWFGRVTFWHFKGWSMLATQFMLAVCAGLLMFARDPVLIGVLFAASGFFISSAYGSSLFHGAAGSTRRTARGAVHESLLATGQISGAFLGGLIYTHSSMQWTYGFCMAIVLTGLVLPSSPPLALGAQGNTARSGIG